MAKQYMKKVILTGLLMGLGPVAWAQTYYLDLHGETLDLPDRTMAVERVLDGRDGHPAFGVVYRGLSNKAAAVLFRHSLEDDLTTFVQAQLPARPPDHPVVLCVRQLRVSEELGNFSERSNADLALDVYEHLPDGYHFVQSTGARISSKGLDVTTGHAGHLAMLLGQCLGQLRTADWAAAARQPTLTLAQLPADAPVALAGGGRRGPAPAILRQAPRRGLYYHFEQFLANQPDTSLTFTLDTVQVRFRSEWAMAKWLAVARVRPLVAGTTNGSRRIVPAGLWGFCDGQQLFVLHNKHFFPLMRQGPFFTFIGEAPADQEYARAKARAQGRAQVAIVASVGEPDHTGEPAAYALDMRTGELAPYPGLHAPTRSDTAYVYVYRPLAPASTTPVRVLLNGHLAGTLLPGDYLELPWAYYARPLHLCLGGVPVASACQYLVPNTSRPSYLRVTPATPTTPWQWMPAHQGAADLDELDKQPK